VEAFMNWLLGGPRWVSKRRPTILPWGDESWREIPSGSFTLSLTSSGLPYTPPLVPGAPGASPNSLDPKGCPSGRSERSKFSSQ
jgi:hypothetical protein